MFTPTQPPSYAPPSHPRAPPPHSAHPSSHAPPPFYPQNDYMPGLLRRHSAEDENQRAMFGGSHAYEQLQAGLERQYREWSEEDPEPGRYYQPGERMEALQDYSDDEETGGASVRRG
eukprot:1526169-Rhodomonas_salina.2